jgi:hypothetical protein
MADGELLEVLTRIAVAAERLAEYFAPAKRKPSLPAHIGTAAYTDEERSRLKLKEELRKKAAPPQPQ